MSYDISMVMDTGGECPAEVEEVGNYTYNCGQMFFQALGGRALSSLHGEVASEIADLVWKAVRDMRDRPAHYRTMNPENGWGDCESAADYLQRLANACSRHPKAMISVT